MLDTNVANSENRRIQRLALSLPLRVRSFINSGIGWEEITRLSDVSAFGAGFSLKHPIKRGRLIQMTIPLPRQLRCYDYSESNYQVWGIVRRCLAANLNKLTEQYIIGVAFIGKNPPESYCRNPSKIYEILGRNENDLWQITDAPAFPDESHISKADRRHSRFPIPVSLIIETLDETRNIIGSEITVTENISFGGASLFTTLNPPIGSFVRVKADQHDFSIIAIVRGKRTGPDGIPRLHIEFIDRFFPLEGIE
ncbi:MAG: PilZ domain-containing protein [Pyrinomonadaceae bacterium]